MGNQQCTPLQPIIVAPPQIRRTTKHDKDVNAVRSVSNPSLVSQFEDEEEQIEISLSQQFNESYMEMIFIKYQTLNSQSYEFVPSESVKSIGNIFDTICMDENIMFLAMKISEAIVRHNDTWSVVFSGCADRNPFKYAETKDFGTDKRIIMHAMMIFRTLKVLINLIEEGNTQQVLNMLDMIALSHLVMKVQGSVLRTFVVCMIKNLLHFKIITDDLLPAFVNFNMKMLEHLKRRMIYWEERHLVLFNEMTDGPSSPAREYYRELKKWRVYVLSCYKYLTKPLLYLEKQIQSTHKLLHAIPVENSTYEDWRIIRCLKKGYKYRSTTDNRKQIVIN